MDGTYEEITYNRLDRATFRDRQGRITTSTYNALRQLVAQTDPLNRTLRYEWCRCGQMRTLIDAMGRATQWKRDLQGRVFAKVYADGSQYTYDYEKASSRLKRRTDAKGQFTDYQWTADDQITRISYPNAEIATSALTYTYDPIFERMTSAIAGPEPYYYTYHQITNGSAPGTGRLAKREGRYPDETLTYSYDSRGLLTQRTIAGLAETWTYDAAKRILTNGTPAGPFTHSYDGATRHLASRTYPNGILSTYTYFGHPDSHRLQRIRHTKASHILAQFDYTYFPSGNIQTWRQQVGDGMPPVSQTYAYDGSDQIISVVDTTGTTEAFSYDKSGNITNTSLSGDATFRTYDPVNNMVSTTAASGLSDLIWDGANRLSILNNIIGHESLTYDANFRFREISKASDNNDPRRTIRISYDKFEIISIFDSTASTPNEHIFGGGSLAISGTSQTFSVHDHLASIRGSLGTNEQFLSYSIRGTSESSRYWSRGFTSHLQLNLNGDQLIIAPFRSYLCSQGRWLSRDLLDENSAFAGNRFIYAKNNPLNVIDPTGLDAPGCDRVGEYSLFQSECARRACAIHDKCFVDNVCTEESWKHPISQIRCTLKCNLPVVGRMALCLADI